MKKSIHSFALAGIVAAALSACGGDDGGSNSVTPPGQASISSANQASVAQAAVVGAMSVAQVQSASSGGQAAAASSALSRVQALLAGGQARRFVATAMAASARPAAVTSDTEPCTFSGTFTTSFNDQDGNNVLSVGDVISVAFAKCSDESDSSIDGTVTITVTSVTNDTQFAGTVALAHVTEVSGGLTSALDGSVTLNETDTETQSHTTLLVGASGLTVTIASSTYNDTIAYAQGLTVDETDDTVNATSTVSINGTFSATSIGGSVTLATAVPIVAFFDDEFASSGQLGVTGANGSKLLLTIVDGATVREQLDANGDGTYEGDTSVAWTTLVPS